MLHSNVVILYPMHLLISEAQALLSGHLTAPNDTVLTPFLWW